MTERPRRSVLVPVLAACSVAAVVAVGVALTRDGGSDPEAAPSGGGTSGTTSVTETPEPTQPTSADATEAACPDPASPGVTVTELTEELQRVGCAIRDNPPSSCADEVGIAGARLAAEIGTTSLWENDQRWVVCDTFASQDGGVPTLLTTYANGEGLTPSPDTLAISENHLMQGGSQYFAAGRVFPGAGPITYHFPDGHDERATTRNGLWVMNYVLTQGKLGRGDSRGLDPITVTVDGQTFTLEWGLGTCAQTNHGC